MQVSLDQTVEYARCARDPWYFLTTYAKVNDSELGIIPFAPWVHLQQLNRIILSNNRVIVLKARRNGISWDLCGLALWYVLFRPSSSILIFSRRETESIAMKERAFFIWRYLPPFLQIPHGKNNDELLEFPAMESKIQSFPSTEGSGRSEGATLVIMDEWAFQQYARENWAGIDPTAERGKIVGVSTANGRANLFAEIYFKAKAGENSFVPVFIPYTVLPWRTKEWHEQKERDMPAYYAWQEYPLNEPDAFLVGGTCMFDVDRLRAAPVRSPSRHLGAAEIWEEYEEDHDYTAGIDTALGIAGRDYSVLQILDATTGRQVAKCRTRIPIEQFAPLARQLLELYHHPMVCVEEQPQGRLVIKELTDNRYPIHRIYHRSKNIPGWHTGPYNRDATLSELEVAVRTNELTIFSQDTIEEMMGFGYNERDNKFEALSGHDDEVMAMMLAWHMYYIRPTLITDWTSTSYIEGPLHRKGELVHTIDWSKPNPFDGTKVIDCLLCASDGCNSCQGQGRVLVYA